MGDTGLKQSANSPGKTRVSKPRAAKSAARPARTADAGSGQTPTPTSDPEKARLDAAWSRLPEHAKQTILTIVEAHDSGSQAATGN